MIVGDFYVKIKILILVWLFIVDDWINLKLTEPELFDVQICLIWKFECLKMIFQRQKAFKNVEKSDYERRSKRCTKKSDIQKHRNRGF